MISAAVQDLLNPVVQALGYDTQWPNVEFDPPQDEIYLAVDYLESQPEEHTFGGDRIKAILQVTVFEVPGKGAIGASTVADAVKTAFDKNTTFTGSGFVVRVDKEPWAGPRLINQQSGRYYIPITIPFEVE